MSQQDIEKIYFQNGKHSLEKSEKRRMEIKKVKGFTLEPSKKFKERHYSR